MIKLKFLGQYLCTIMLLGFLVASCNPKSDSSKTETDTKTTEAESTKSEEEKPKANICVWDKVPVWSETDSKTRKYVAALNMGEKAESLNDDKTVTENGKELVYQHVKLSDNRTGWVDSRFIASHAEAVAITGTLAIYDRPELLAKTERVFEPFDVVAVLKTQGDWAEVYGKRAQGNWMEKVWVKNNSMSKDEKDLAVAVRALRALGNKDETKKLAELKKVANDPDLQGSAFTEELNKRLGIDTKHEAMPDSTAN